MNYANIKPRDIANGPGIRVSLFVSGCTHRCPGCFNAEAWDFAYGQPFDQTVIDRILADLAPDFISGLTLLGGDPFEPENQRALLPFLQRVRRELPKKNIWAFTGFVLDKELWVDGSYPRCEVTDELLELVDVLVDGRFVESLKNVTLKFRGSSNQRLIDMNKTRTYGEIVPWK